MVEKDADKSNVVRKSLFLAIYVTIIYLMLILPVTVNIYNGGSCGTSEVKNAGSLTQQALSTFVIEDNNNYVLQKFDVGDISAVGYRFCYFVDVNSTNGLAVEVINDKNVTLGKDFVRENKNDYCTELDSDLLSEVNFLGVRCINCDASNNVTLLRELAGLNVENYLFTPDLEIELSSSYLYALYSLDNCKSNLKNYAVAYLWIIFSIILVVWIIVGNKYVMDTFVRDIVK